MKPLPRKVQTLCEKFLVELEDNPQHHLKASDRFLLYTSIGKLNFYGLLPNPTNIISTDTTSLHLSRFSVADFTIAWLAILTSQKVLPVWDRIWQQVTIVPDTTTSPGEIISICTAIVQNKVEIAKIRSIEYDKYNLGGNITFWTNYDVAWVYKCAYATLLLILYGFDGGMDIKGEHSFADDKMAPTNNFASLAVQAYSAIDKNKPGNHTFDKQVNLVEFDLQKRLEFWKWGLTQTVPQAWELAQQSFAFVR